MSASHFWMLLMERLSDLSRRISALPKGIAFARAAAALVVAKGYLPGALAHAEKWRDSPGTYALLDNIAKTAVAAGDTTDSAWASPLSQPDFAAAEFAELLTQGTVLGRLRGIRRVPLNVRYPRVTSGASVSWVGSGQPTPVSKLQLATNTLGFAKVAGIVVVTQELARLSDPASETLLRDDLLRGATEFIDAQVLSPGVAAVVDQNPASISFGITPSVSSGSTAALIHSDLSAMLVTMADANETEALYWVMTKADAARLSAKTDTTGAQAFPLTNINGGTLLGVPVLTTNVVPHSVSGGSMIFLINAAGIDYATLDQVMLSVSTQAALQLNDAPSPGAQQLVSLWQENLAAIKLVKFANYRRVRDSAVTYLDNAHW